MREPRDGRVERLLRYPVKGLSGEDLPAVDLAEGDTVPFDRAFAIEAGSNRFDPLTPKHFPKINFIMRMRDERLAQLDTRFDQTDNTLTIFRAGKQVARGQLTTPIGRQMIEQFIAGFMGSGLRGAPKIVAADGHSFSDVPVKCLHIINLASVDELSRAMGVPIDPLRFRANVHLADLPAWAENDWIGRQIRLGAVDLEVIDRTVRCAATDVNPADGARDLAIPQALQRHFGFDTFGVYATVQAPGRLAVGDQVSRVDAP